MGWQEKEFTHHDTSSLIRRLLIRLSPGSLLTGNLEENVAGVIVVKGVVSVRKSRCRMQNIMVGSAL
jgi:hypothetical protein